MFSRSATRDRSCVDRPEGPAAMLGGAICLIARSGGVP